MKDWENCKWNCLSCGFIGKNIAIVSTTFEDQKIKVVTCIKCGKRVEKYKQ